MTEYLQFSLTLLASAGVSAALCAAMVWLARAWISERLKASIKHEYDERMAAMNASLKAQGDSAAAMLKGEIDREADKLRLAAQSFGEVQKAAISKRLTAIEEVWRVVMALNEAIPGAMSYLDILLVSEYLSAPNQQTFRAELQRLDHRPIVLAASERARELAQFRPYIGEYLWALFATYQAVTLRTIYLIDRSKVEPSKLMWHQDAPIRQQIQSALGPNALSEFDSAEVGKVSWIQDRFTRAILQAMERILAGKEFGEAALKQAEAMEAQIRQSKRVAENV